MSSKKGNISVSTTDIFPIIKKWLYSEHDIFLRELVANATDAITKRSTLARSLNQEIPTGKISVKVSNDNKQIIIEDNGLGMSEEEVEKYIAQLAYSGAEEFVKKMKDEESGDIIGKFGLGFYSAFMVADKIELETLSMKDGSTSVKWTCEGDTEYVFSESKKDVVGTTITLHINEESKEFLDHYKVSQTLKKFCDFLPYTIEVWNADEKPTETKNEKGESEITNPTPVIVNETEPLWKKSPTEVTDEEYKAFFKKLYPMEAEPLFWIHLKVDHPFLLEGILYFPKLNPNKPFNESNIRLYCKQMFVSDNVKNIIPEFLALLKGSIDSTDIPLNVSRSSLQGDPNIRRISNYIIKKVAESLKTLHRKDREKYDAIWQDIAMFVKYGCISDDKFDKLMRPYVLFKNSIDKLVTLPEYKEQIPEDYKEKLKDTVLYFEKGKSDYSIKAQLNEQKVYSLETDEHIDPHFIQHVENKSTEKESVKFSSIDSKYEEIFESEATNEEDMKIKDLFAKFLVGEAKETDSPMSGKDVEISKIKNSTTPAFVKIDEQMKRFGQMAQSMGQNQSFPIKKTLVINPNNSLIKNALKIHEKGGQDHLVEKICHHVEDLANISSAGLQEDEKEVFLKRSQELMEQLTGLAL